MSIPWDQLTPREREQGLHIVATWREWRNAALKPQPLEQVADLHSPQSSLEPQRVQSTGLTPVVDLRELLIP